MYLKQTASRSSPGIRRRNFVFLEKLLVLRCTLDEDTFLASFESMRRFLFRVFTEDLTFLANIVHPQFPFPLCVLLLQVEHQKELFIG